MVYIASDFGVSAVTGLLGISLLTACLVVVQIRARRQYRRLSRQLQLYRAAVDEHCMVNVSDAAGRITAVNDRFLASSGFERSAVLGRTLCDLAPGTVTPKRIAEVDAALRAGRPWRGETEWRRADGTAFWTRSTIVPVLDRAGRLVESFAIRTDISEVKKTGSEAQLRATLDLLQDEVWMFTPEDHRILYMNGPARRRAAADGWGPAGTAAGTLPATLDAAGGLDDPDRLRHETARLLRGEARSATYEVQRQGPDGTERVAEVTLQLIAPVGNAPRFVAVLRDITERQAAARAKSQFVAMVSHELRTPLTSIKGGLGLLAMSTMAQLSDRGRSLLSVALRNTDRLMLLINDILDLEKIDAGMMDFTVAPLDLCALVAEAAEAHAGYGAEFGVRFVTVCPDGPVRVNGSAPRLMQVMANLMSNAARFSSPGEVVELGVQVRDGRARVHVRDRGAGIPVEAQPRILMRFTQAEGGDRRRTGGTGLGLSIVKAILERHGSEIRFVSTPGEGSEFFFDLPVLTAEDGSADPAAGLLPDPGPAFRPLDGGGDADHAGAGTTPDAPRLRRA
ncbi:sensor histidine kinase [Frigidibacter oleivorans]|uniref:sensor histidine kinase n=1 Tax=Frigidibacter oleivorans TaxID=2487129 RepID=UPI0013E08249|nr:ATP-binding protein [Frigidibacter oleivorans]